MRPAQLDADTMLLNLDNGTFDLRAPGRLRPHSGAELITKLAPVPFAPDATCPLWLAFVDRIFAGRLALIEFVQRAVGYSLTGDISERCFLILWGLGANGKTTFLNVIAAMLGDYAAATRAETFMLKKGTRSPMTSQPSRAPGW